MVEEGVVSLLRVGLKSVLYKLGPPEHTSTAASSGIPDSPNPFIDSAPVNKLRGVNFRQIQIFKGKGFHHLPPLDPIVP
eukprot:CAMPEP_0184502486 /NCGR_PEP_ID=MMETSP0113_2-20130426/50478_1 /TAXON_ID=91329 /ORGANISM="Norrisiella sphaerica, Strain BC52" /LENGTH=78 /DNA_ID=CAMNT_0026891689 /DNA_START=890 /DNA_END=1126 /DNA_ORIENTATION=+